MAIQVSSWVPAQLSIKFGAALIIFFVLAGCYASNTAALDLGSDFNHDETSFPLDFKHALISCESCHVDGIFVGTPRQCASCHSDSGRIKASAPSSQHIRVTGDCDYCHTPTLWTNIIRVDHAAVRGSCASCHNGVTAEGKNPGHVPSSNICDACHITLSWKFYHIDTTSNCVSCHNGGFAEGKNPGHIPSTASCEDCHNTRDWIPVIRVDHGSVIGTCFSCHNGVIAEGKDPMHIPSGNDCEACHSVLGWTPATPP
ncbi:MAG: hypothetical protein OES20_03160 [Gammaproteobacteria bacterium]|nr:hypothetical protein [Gammaproteobacteria bacterium]